MTGRSWQETYPNNTFPYQYYTTRTHILSVFVSQSSRTFKFSKVNVTTTPTTIIVRTMLGDDGGINQSATEQESTAKSSCNDDEAD